MQEIGLSRRQLIVLMAGLVAVSASATNIYVPTLPAITDEFGATTATAQLTLTAYFAGIAVTQLIYGPLSDRFGRRPILFVGLALFIAASGACALAPSIEFLIGARFFQAAGACAAPVISRAVLRDVFDSKGTAQAMAGVTMGTAIAPAAAPVIGAYIYLWASWRFSFAVVAVFAALILVISLRRLPETLPRGEGREPHATGLLSGYVRLMKSPYFVIYSFTSAFIFCALFSFVADAPYIMINVLHQTAQAYAWYGLITVVGFAGGAFAAGRLTSRLGIDRTIALGLCITLAGGILFPVLSLTVALSIASLIVPMFIVVFGMGLVFPNATAGAISIYPEVAGSASALLGFFQMVGAGLAVVLVSVITDGTHIPMTLAVAFFSILAAGTFSLSYLRRG